MPIGLGGASDELEDAEVELQVVQGVAKAQEVQLVGLQAEQVQDT